MISLYFTFKTPNFFLRHIDYLTFIFLFLFFFLILSACHAVNKMCNICVSTTCLYRGARIFEDAMKSLATDDVAVNTPGCLRKCGKGVVFKAFGEHLDPPPKGCFGWYPVVDDEAEAVRAACDLLEKMGGLDEEKKADIETRMAAGERVLTAQEPPKWESRCEACGAGLVSEKTTETCLACGGSGERVFFGKF